MNNGAVDIVMPVRNAMPYLPAAIASLQAQTFDRWRLLVVDDGSTDDGPTWCAEAGDDRITVLPTLGSGIADALNTGLAATTSTLVARMDGDDECRSDRLERQVDRMGDTALVALGSSFEVIDESGCGIATQVVQVGPAVLAAALVTTNPFCHGSLVFRSEALKRVGGYRDAFPLAEDYDLLLRLSTAGPLDNLLEPLYRWRFSPSSTSVRHPRRQAVQAARARGDARRQHGLARQGPRATASDGLNLLLAEIERRRPPTIERTGHRWRAGLHRGEGRLAEAIDEYDALLAERPWDLASRFRRRRTRSQMG